MSKEMSPDYELASVIYLFNNANKPVWFTRLCEVMDGRRTRNQISHLLDVLDAYCITDEKYAKTDDGRGVWVLAYNIDQDAQGLIKEACDKYSDEGSFLFDVNRRIEGGEFGPMGESQEL